MSLSDAVVCAAVRPRSVLLRRPISFQFYQLGFFVGLIGPNWTGSVGDRSVVDSICRWPGSGINTISGEVAR